MSSSSSSSFSRDAQSEHDDKIFLFLSIIQRKDRTEKQLDVTLRHDFEIRVNLI